MTFAPGDRVQWVTKDLTGTVVPDEKCKEWPGFLAIQWDNGDRTLSAPTHLKTAKSGGALAKEHTTAKESNTLIGADSMNNITPFPKAPAGFKLEHFCSCGMGCTPDDLNADDNCEILGSNYVGPGAHIIGPSGGQVNSYWSAKDGITFQVLNYRDNDKGEYVQRPWTLNELDQLPAMVDRVKIQIDEAHAREYFTNHPELLKTLRTVNDMARIADDHHLNPSVVYTVWAEANAEEIASWK